MADGHGGHRPPANPAAVSGPGALSARTDSAAEMIPSGGGYGDRKAMAEIQSGAQMMPDRSVLMPLGAPSSRPGEPVTAGADAGAGMGMQAAGIKTERQISDERLRPLMYGLELLANSPHSNPETKTFVRNLKARLSNG